MATEAPDEIAQQLQQGTQFLHWWITDKESDSIRVQYERAANLRRAGVCFKAIVETLTAQEHTLLLRMGETAIRANRWSRDAYDFIVLRGHRTINPGEALAFERASERSVPYLRLQDDAAFREPVEMNLSSGLLDVPMSQLATALSGNAEFSIIPIEEGRAIAHQH